MNNDDGGVKSDAPKRPTFDVRVPPPINSPPEPDDDDDDDFDLAAVCDRYAIYCINIRICFIVNVVSFDMCCVLAQIYNIVLFFFFFAVFLATTRLTKISLRLSVFQLLAETKTIGKWQDCGS
jgi:hypothetical protein